MNILQISAPKSGSYWLYSILLQILEKKGIPKKSFIQNQPVFKKAKNLELSFKGQAGVDMIDIEEDGAYYRISSVIREKIKDPEAYSRSTTVAWTHSTLCTTSFEIFPLFDKKICIIRDPRDRALSSARFRVSSYMQKYYPSAYSSANAYLQDEYERLIEQWVWYTGNYLIYKEELNIHFIFYERLLHNFEEELKSLLQYLQLSLTTKDQEEIAAAVAFSSMKKESPSHLKRGKYGKWRKELKPSQKEVAIKKAGKLLEILNYPLNAEDSMLPSLPTEIPKEELPKIVDQINWQKLFE